MLTLNQVTKVYSGINGRCCCGCAGKHTTREESPRSVKLIFNKILKAGAQQDSPSDNHIYAVAGKRLYVAYSD